MLLYCMWAIVRIIVALSARAHAFKSPRRLTRFGAALSPFATLKVKFVASCGATRSCQRVYEGEGGRGIKLLLCCWRGNSMGNAQIHRNIPELRRACTKLRLPKGPQKRNSLLASGSEQAAH